MVLEYLQNWVILDKGKCWDSYSSTMVSQYGPKRQRDFDDFARTF